MYENCFTSNVLSVDCMLHHKRKTWFTIQMKQADEIPSDNDCANNMIKAFRKHAKNVVNSSLIFDDALIFM